MIYICPNCWSGFTIPVGDYMREKNLSCTCGSKSKYLLIGEPHHIDGKVIHSTLYNILK